MFDPQKVIEIALLEVGYREKGSNAQLDDKSANAGAKNYTKFAALMDSIKGWYNGRKQGVAWCAVFVHSCVVILCMMLGIDPETARKVFYLPRNSSGAGVRWCRIYAIRAGRYKQRGTYTPAVGDQIVFKDLKNPDPNAMQHTGWVRTAYKQRVYTIEGNTSNRVMLKSYLLTDPRIDGYIRPNYGIAAPATPANPVVELPTLSKGSTGMYVTEIQVKLNAFGFSPPLKIDGIFGPKTKRALKWFQICKKIKPDGVCGPVTWAALKAVSA